MIEIPQSTDMKDIAQLLEQSGFTVMYAEANRISLNKGHTENGFADKVYHIHLRYAGDNDELYFRDYLNEHPAVAKNMKPLKLRLGNNMSMTGMHIQMRRRISSPNGRQKLHERNMETDTDKYPNLDEEKKMIILITGASHTGKTLLAQKMPEKYKYPYPRSIT